MAKSMSGKMATAQAPAKSPPTWRKRFEQNIKILNSSSCRPCLRQSYIALLHQKQQLRAMKRLGTVKKTSAYAPPLVVIGPKTGSIGTKAQVAAAERADRDETRNRLEKKRKMDAAYLKPPPAPKRPNKPAGQDPTGYQAEDEITTSQKSEEPRSRPDKLDTSTTGAPNSKPSTPKPTSPATPTGLISKLWPTNVGAQKTKGLYNPNNFCYRNTALQSLLCIPQFMNLLNTSHRTDCKKACVVCRLRDLTNAYQGSPGDWNNIESQRKALDTAVSRCRSQTPTWREFSKQADTHEFLSYLLQWVEQSQGKSKDNFNSIYTTRYRHTYICHDCNTTHTNDEADVPVPYLILALRGNSVADCMDFLHANEELEIRCDKCQTSKERLRTTKILTAPEVLYIQLIRFTADRRKDFRHIQIPNTLDLSRWAEGNVRKGNMFYELKAVALHSGVGLRSGHYLTVVKAGNKWVSLNDTHVSDTNFAATQGKGSSTPYVLTYVKVDPKDKSS